MKKWVGNSRIKEIRVEFEDGSVVKLSPKQFHDVLERGLRSVCSTTWIKEMMEDAVRVGKGKMNIGIDGV